MSVVCPACGSENPNDAIRCQGCSTALRKFTLSDPAPLERIQAFNSWHQRENAVRRRRFRHSGRTRRVSTRWIKAGVVAMVLAVGAGAAYFFVAGAGL